MLSIIVFLHWSPVSVDSLKSCSYQGWFCPVLLTALTRKIPSSLIPGGYWVCSNPSNTDWSESISVWWNYFCFGHNSYISLQPELYQKCAVVSKKFPGNRNLADKIISHCPLCQHTTHVLRSCCKLWWWWRMILPPACTPGSAGCCSGQTVCPPHLQSSSLRGQAYQNISPSQFKISSWVFKDQDSILSSQS